MESVSHETISIEAANGKKLKCLVKKMFNSNKLY